MYFDELDKETQDYSCKCQYKNVVFLSYKRVEKPTRLYDIFNCLQSYIAFGLLVCMKDHLY